jgi:ice-binding like protein
MKKILVQLITGLILLSLPVFNFAQSPKFARAPHLGTAATFVLFTASGAVTNNGISQITGNVGTNSGSSTGFGNVNGVMHDNDGASAASATDLMKAYNQLDTTTATFFPASSLGNGDTLVPGVYKISAVTTLNGELILDAQGHENAVFIFQIEAAFSTTAASKIKLIHHAKACNVFWKVEGLVSMASNTYMRGTVIAHNAAINMNTNDTLEGRALSTTGAVSTDGVLAYTPIGCGSPLLTGPAAPDLGAAACYGIFSGNGEVTNSGVTYVTGDIGTNVGLTTGFNPLYVKGTIHSIPDGSTAACAADLLNVYKYLNTLPADIELLYPAQFGNNLVLTPHTYVLNAATAFNGTVYLNAAGDSNAVFVIKINGALTTSTYSRVVLMNGAKAKNVYWKVEGAVNINDYSVFYGTIVCNNGAINLTTGDSIKGRALTTNGALSTHAIVTTTPSNGCNILPVSWLYFRGTPVQKSVLLEWGTASEMNNSFFTIEKGGNGKTFTTLTTVNAFATTGKLQNNYSFTDQQPYNSAYYRISQTDKDGQKSYFNTIQVKMNTSADFQATAYIKGNYINVQTSGAPAGNGLIELYSIQGKKMSSQNIMLTPDANTYKIQKPLQKGTYLLTITGNGKKLYSGKIMVL